MVIIKFVLAAFCLFLLSNLTTAQTVGLSLDKLKTAASSVGMPPQYSSLFLKKIAIKKLDNQSITSNQPTKVPSIFSVEALPFFCKIEYKMGLNKKLPIKFRLGDVQYVDELEGKH
jgi:hypothetical protein